MRTGAALAGAIDARNLDLDVKGPAEGISRNPELALYEVQTNAYKFSWALIPISLPFIWLMFAWRRDVTMFDHAVFATYSLSAVTLWCVAMSLLAATGIAEPLIGAGLFLVPPVHIYRDLRGTYGLTWSGALWRTILLLFFALVALNLFLIMLISLDLMH